MANHQLVQQRGNTVSAPGATESGLPATEAGTLAAVAREESEIKAAILAARHFPRDEITAQMRIMKVVERPLLAEKATYKFPRGDGQTIGPSVYLAREMARCWGNLQYGLRVVSIDDDYVHIVGYAFDLETNTRPVLEDKFERLIQKKVGKGRDAATKWVRPDERELRELINRRGAILVRNCLLQVLPYDIVDEAQQKAKETRQRAASGELKRSREDTLRSLVSAFDDFGVSKQMIEDHLDHSVATISAEELAELREIFTSLKDGNSTREDQFVVKRSKESSNSQASDLNAQLQALATEAKVA